MKLRYRFSLLVGAIFFICFSAFAFIDVSLTKKYFQNSSDFIRTHLLSLKDIERSSLQMNLAKELDKRQALINALLLNLSHQSKSSYLNSWDKMVNIYDNNKWINFLQVTKSDQTSVIIPFHAMKMAHKEPIDEGLSWVLVEGEEPYLGVTLLNEAESLKIEIHEDKGRFQLLFPLGSLQEEKTTGILAIDRAITFAKTSPIPPDRFKESMTDEFRGVNSHNVSTFLQNIEKSAMLTNLIFFLSRGSSIVPAGIASFTNLSNQALLIQNVFYHKAIFQDADHLQKHPPAKEGQEIGSDMAFISIPEKKQFFFGNTGKLQSNELLTIGINLESVIKQHLLQSHEAAFVIYNGEVIAGYTDSGESPEPLILSNAMLQTPSGLTSWSGDTYCYLHMQPFTSLDLHFYTLDLEKRAFSLNNFLEAAAKTSLVKLSWNIRIIGLVGLFFVLIILYMLFKRIAKPIAQLAEATNSIAAGKLENISLPVTSKGKWDEVSTLCHSFAKMVEELKEKEEVKAVVNKVVSKEIAEEILKGNVHLGGEERKVTVLFVDIRRFTEITTQLHPQEIITLLNACMTRISAIIDEQGGIIDKYLGDEVMAFFGAPIDHGDSALRAIRSGLKIVEAIKTWNKEQEKQGLGKIELGIGIHSGVVLIGNMGAENRLNYTVIGRNVNLAARLCSQARRSQILISKETFEEPLVQENIFVKELPKGELRLSVFEVAGLISHPPQYWFHVD